MRKCSPACKTRPRQHASTYTLLDQHGRPVPARIHDALLPLIPALVKWFPVLADEVLLLDTLERAARKLCRRERLSGPIAQIEVYAWVVLHRTATWRTRYRDGRLAQVLLESRVRSASLPSIPGRIGSAEQIESAVLWREVLAHLSADERRVFLLKRDGWTSEEIAQMRGGTAASVNTLFWRARRRIRELLR
jgi:DNA-directed RNA polymerase specialized sigma24 family protein